MRSQSHERLWPPLLKLKFGNGWLTSYCCCSSCKKIQFQFSIPIPIPIPGFPIPIPFSIPPISIPIPIPIPEGWCSSFEIWLWWTVGWINIKMPSYQYRKSHCGDKTILRPSYLHNGISYTGKMASLYLMRAQVFYNDVALFVVSVELCLHVFCVLFWLWRLNGRSNQTMQPS